MLHIWEVFYFFVTLGGKRKLAQNIILQIDRNISAISTTNKTQIVLLLKHEPRLGFQKLLHNVRCLCFTEMLGTAQKCKLGCSLSYNGFNTAYTC